MTRRLLLLVLAALLPCAYSAAGSGLQWDRQTRRVDADIHGWDINQLLRGIATATGWEVLAEPGLELRVAARFENRTEREALSILLRDLNFALLPGGRKPARLLVFRSDAARATKAIQPETGHRVLAHELVVRWKGSPEELEALVSSLGGRIAGRLDKLGAYRLVFENEEAAHAARAVLERTEGAERLESNYALPSPNPQNPPKPAAPSDGEGTATPAPPTLKARPANDESSVVIALLDTAVAADAVQHSDFLLPGLGITPEAAPAPTDGPGHGSAMFETIVQGLSVTLQGEEGTPVRVLPIDIYGSHEETSTFALAQGIVAALEHGADVINLSLSGPSPSPILQDVLRQAAASGVLTFVAPGNQPTVDPTYPAAYPEVLAVTASDHAGRVADYANRGPFVDLIAPGMSLVPYTGSHWVVEGTSVATAYAAGIAAGLLADSGLSPAAIAEQMRQRIGFIPAQPEP